MASNAFERGSDGQWKAKIALNAAQRAAAAAAEEELIELASSSKQAEDEATDQADADLAIAIQEESNEPSLSLRLLYFGVAVLVTSLPAYIWVAVLSMPRHKGMIVVVTIGSALIVTFAYYSVAYQTVLRLAHCQVASKAKEEGVRQRQLIRRLVFISCAGIKHCSRCCPFSVPMRMHRVRMR
jgi:hypothetical protein